MRIIVIVFALALVGSPAGAENFLQRFEEAALTKDDSKVDQVVAAWKAAEPQNPEVYVKAANYYLAKDHRDLIQKSTKPPRKGDFALKDPKSGKVVGSMGPLVVLNPTFASRAAGILHEATRKFPDRVDIWFGLAYIHKELNNFDKLYATFKEAFNYTTSHPAELKWKGGRPLSRDPAELIPKLAQVYIKDYFKRGTPQNREQAFRLAKLVAASFPKHPYPLNVIAVYYAKKKDWAKAVSHFERAHKLDPNDAFIMINLGMTYADMNENEKARIFFEKVIASDAKEAIRELARKHLEKLK